MWCLTLFPHSTTILGTNPPSVLSGDYILSLVPIGVQMVVCVSPRTKGHLNRVPFVVWQLGYFVFIVGEELKTQNLHLD